MGQTSGWDDPRRRRLGQAILGLFALAAVVVMVLKDPVAPPRDYHDFADRLPRCWGIPNAWNVLSNLPFLLVGLYGLRALAGKDAAPMAGWRRQAAVVLFAGIALVAFGSAYYHWRPANLPLIFDRLPITVVFMALFGLIIGDCVDDDLGRRLWRPLIGLGAVTAVIWLPLRDLRPYGIVQYGSMGAIAVLALLLRPRQLRAGPLWIAVLLYLVAKACEAKPIDNAIFTMTEHWLSGHTLKHLLAAAATAALVSMIIPPSPSGPLAPSAPRLRGEG